METSGTGSRVIDESTGNKHAANQSLNTSSRAGTSASKANKGSLEFSNADELKQVISDVRTNKDGLTWVLFTYDGEDSNVVTLMARGSGDVDADLVPQFNDKVVAYGLVRKVERIDETEAVKFCFIRFAGNNINRMLKARLGTHFGTISQFFHPYHVTIDATEPTEISDEIIMKTIKNASGTSVHVVHETPSKPSTTAATSTRTTTAPKSTNTTKQPSVPKNLSTAQSVQVKDEDVVKANIKEVRSGNPDVEWCLVGYEGGKGSTLIPLATGANGIQGLLEHLNDKVVAYALIRKNEKIDESVTTKFAHIIFIGENIDRMHRARLGTHKGGVQALFTPYHVDITVSNVSELSDEIIVQKIAEASGTFNKVKG